MDRRVTRYPCKDTQADLFALSLLLAEGQVGSRTERWSMFIDQLAKITDAFASARAERTADDVSGRVLVSA